ncbi:MAG: glycoside hydrolase family 125 protein, partial [Ancalomicrobiaceae bacterium]|nr:glycoside hydrolase family 125 protein [Ancalomicrobiaceae bacterium]
NRIARTGTLSMPDPDAKTLSPAPTPGLVRSGLAAAGRLVALSALTLEPHDVVPTGNEWLSMPDIRAADGAVMSFNVLSKRYRGLLQARGPQGRPVIRPVVSIDGREVELGGLAWSVIAFWIPVARATIDGLEIELTYCAPLGVRAAFLHMKVANRRAGSARIELGADVAWGALERVTYYPVELTGTRRAAPGVWVDDATTFAYRTDDTRFAWSVVHRGMRAELGDAPQLQTATLRGEVTEIAPGGTAEANIILAVGLEEMSAPHNAKALAERIDRLGAAGVIRETATRLMASTRSTGRDDLDLLMNRNALFTRFYAWGRTIDAEEMVGVTSRSPRYYVSAAYWDRDSMLWSFPALLRFDPETAREALAHALGTQLRNTGIHSRFIDGVVLEDGFQLDEAAAPVIALADYLRVTGDRAFLDRHAGAVDHLAATIARVRDATTGLYMSWQDAQDEYRRHPFLTNANVMIWQALGGLSFLSSALGRGSEASRFAAEADHLKQEILKHLVIEKDGKPIFVAGWDGKADYLVEDIPPGSLFKLAALGFVAEDDPVFAATSAWLQSSAYAYGYHDAPYGLPGSYRLSFTTSWVLADHLRLESCRDKALMILTHSTWDGGIITEGLDPVTGRMDRDGRAFATAAGYVAAAIYDVYGTPSADAVHQIEHFRDQT